ncbi:MAG TPA: amidohydrolase family protein [Candidatus Saccharimonadales bacterium]|nr:amidohydrolase family protein [Candidatus Saccharimonadales bacterium]
MLVLRDVRVVDGRGIRAERADVLLRDGRIAIVSDGRLPSDATAGAEIVDLPGRTIVPGLMNAHAHVCLDGSSPDPKAILRTETQAENAVRSAARLLRALQSGVTAIRDVGAPWGVDIALKGMVDRGEIPGPRMITAGRNITMTGGHGHWMGMEADGPDGVRHAARTQIKAGATAIKLMATGGMMTPHQVAGAPQLTIEEMRAACEEAHKAGFPVAAHSESDEGSRNAVLAGVDSVEHGHGLTAETIGLMLERGTVLVPTILSDRAIVEGGIAAGIPDYVVEKCVALAESLVVSLELGIRMGLTIAAGNDGGAPLVEIGQMAGELELYVRHGLTPQQALEAGTINTARLFRMGEVGYLEPGWHADLLVLDGDPLRDVTALRSPAMVFKAGESIGAAVGSAGIVGRHETRHAAERVP